MIINKLSYSRPLAVSPRFLTSQSLRARTDGRYIAKIYRPRTEFKKQKKPSEKKEKKKRPIKKKKKGGCG
jgi:hypothetical protein